MVIRALDSFDVWLLTAIDQHRSAAFDAAARGLLQLGHTAPGVIVCAVAGLAVVARFGLWRACVAACLGMIVAGQLADRLKGIVERPRPPAALALVDTSGFAMPSSVAAASGAAVVACLLTVRWQTRRLRRLFAALFAAALLLVGAAMVYLGAHWFSDVIAGWALGAVVGAVAGYGSRDRRGVNAAVRSA